MNDNIPKIGFGTWKIEKDVCSDIIYNAIKTGYRHIDCACDYGNEIEVGLGIKRALDEKICSREELWITSKLWNTYHDKKNVLLAIQKSLEDLDLEYLDLYLIHFPIALKFVPFEQRYPPEWVYNLESSKMEFESIPLHETWSAMENLVDNNLTRYIGVCNYNSSLLNDLMNYSRIRPKVLQIESHPYLTQEKLIRLAKIYNLDVTVFSPLGALSYLELNMADFKESLLENKVIINISKKYDKTPAQILLRWGVQRGTSVVTKTTKLNRMNENLDILNFELEKSDLDKISTFNCNKRFNDPGVFCEGAFNTFYSIYD